MAANLHRCIVILVLTFSAAALLCCGKINPNDGRVLTSISVTPVTADAQSFPNGQVTYTATGTFSLPPLSGPISPASPYNGSFVVDNPASETIANIVSSDAGLGTITVQCAAGAIGDVEVTESASANNGTSIVVAGNAQLTCP
jgi:hypothetical protein